MSLEETARTSCGCEGKRCSIFLDCPNPGSLVEKKKFSSTTGLRSTNTATKTNNTMVMASISQCAPKRAHFLAMEEIITRFDVLSQRDSTSSATRTDLAG